MLSKTFNKGHTRLCKLYCLAAIFYSRPLNFAQTQSTDKRTAMKIYRLITLTLGLANLHKTRQCHYWPLINKEGLRNKQYTVFMLLYFMLIVLFHWKCFDLILHNQDPRTCMAFLSRLMSINVLLMSKPYRSDQTN